MLDKMFKNQWPFFMATNSFCGPIELRGADGQSLPPLKPNVSSAAAYPAAYHVEAAHASYFFRPGASLDSGIFPNPLFGNGLRSELVRFRLEEYFALKQPGEYQLTVWPKVYKRLSTTNDVCERIDVPPVSVAVKWP